LSLSKRKRAVLCSRADERLDEGLFERFQTDIDLVAIQLVRRVGSEAYAATKRLIGCEAAMVRRPNNCFQSRSAIGERNENGFVDRDGASQDDSDAMPIEIQDLAVVRSKTISNEDRRLHVFDGKAFENASFGAAEHDRKF